LWYRVVNRPIQYGQKLKVGQCRLHVILRPARVVHAVFQVLIVKVFIGVWQAKGVANIVTLCANQIKSNQVGC
jgi:hypothetical protein